MAFLISVFVAGIATFLSPCTLPVVPAYLVLVGDLTLEEVGQNRIRVLKGALWFVAGFTLVFMLFGLLVGSAASAFAQHKQIITMVAGYFLVAIGVSQLAGYKLFGVGQPKEVQISHRGLQLLFVGAGFAASWTPCIGPILASVLLVAATTGSLVYGILLLFIFAAGMMLPFLLIAGVMNPKNNIFKKLGKHTELIQKVLAVVIIMIGLLMGTGLWGRVTAQFGSVSNDALLNYL